MAGAAASAGMGGAGGAAAGGSGNPFQLATNLYCEKNQQALVTNYTLTTTQSAQGGAINSGQYLRGIHLILRTVSAGASGTTAASAAPADDRPWNYFTQTDLVNVDGSEILYPMGGYAHYLRQKYSKPWLGDPNLYYDAANGTTIAPQCTLFLQPEIRWTAGVLANTDTRSQYRFDYTIDTLANVVSAATGGNTFSTGPSVSVTPYVDSWAQPDAEDLQGTANQPVPPGLNLQVKSRHQIFTMNANGSDNILQSALTGNALRNQILVHRNGGSIRSEGLTDPIYWYVDNRSLGKISVNRSTTAATGLASGDMVADWMAEFYQSFFPSYSVTPGNGLAAGFYMPHQREVGVYVFPRFIKPGDLFGQGWLYSANSTKEIFESVSNVSTSGTLELISDEVYPVGPVDPSLTDI